MRFREKREEDLTNRETRPNETTEESLVQASCCVSYEDYFFGSVNDNESRLRKLACSSLCRMSNGNYKSICISAEQVLQ
jgi:hypothetical protein